MNEPLTRSESQSMLDDLKKEINRINNLIKEKKVGGAAIEFLDEKKNFLQKHFDEILSKGGIITEDDFNKTYNLIRAQEQKELIDLKKRQTRWLIGFGVVVIGLIVAYKLLSKKN